LAGCAVACYQSRITRGRGVVVVDVQEIKKIDAYLKRLFSNPRIQVRPRPKKDDSAEVYIGDEFIGVLFVDDEDDDRSYNFQMAILETDLE
jgi:PP-loop superfamily ATP-utilizing enzyme